MENEEEMFEKVKSAFTKFFKNNTILFDVNVNERSITHKLAEYLQEAFSDMDVDCEYNRHSNLVKIISVYEREKIKPSDLEAKTVYPDIVIHKRREDDHNLLVIEVKKANSARRTNKYDEKKLKAFTGNDFHYKIGLYVEINVGNKCVSKITCFKKGKEDTNTIWVRLQDV
jgi:hypothetical protein